MADPKIIPNRGEYTCEKIMEEQLSEFFYSFHRNFIDYVKKRVNFGRNILELYNNKEELKATLRPLVDESTVSNFPNFNRYVGDLERACNAAQSLQDYDLCIGIAKKGTWLSYVFNLHNFFTGEALVIRHGIYDDGRFIHPLFPLSNRDIRGKRILVCENDLVTGESVRVVAEKILSAGAKSVDLLLIYRQTRLDHSYYEEIKQKFRGSPEIIGKSENGEIVIDTLSEVPNNIGKTFALDINFLPERKCLDNLMQKLGFLKGESR